MAKNRALFLDRDGVICKALSGYLTKWEEFELLPGIKELIDHAREKEYIVVVVTNQPQVAKGILKEGDLIEIHSKMQVLLDNKIHRIYYCPHTDADNCDCRKPKAGMLRHAAQDFDIDYAKSVMVGDSDKDVLAGQAVGCKTIFVKNEFKTQYLANCSPDRIVENPKEVIPFI